MNKEFGKWLLDIAKYVTTAVIISTWLSGFENWEWYYILLLLGVIAVVVWWGLSLIRKDEMKENRKKKR
jgi:hypothetical protein